MSASPEPVVPQLRPRKSLSSYPDYVSTDSRWLPEFPRGWSTNRLKFLATINPSNVDKRSEEDEESIRLCNYTDVYYEDEITDDLDFMEATASSEEIQDFSLQKDDVIVTKDSESWDDIAVPAFVPQSLNRVLCGYHLAIIRAIEERASGRFLSYAFQAENIAAQLRVEASGITRYGLTVRALQDAQFPVPPLGQQTLIADFLDQKTSKIDRLIDKKECLIELLEERRTALITKAVTKGLDPDAPLKESGVEWLGKIPEHWNVAPTKYVARLETGHTPSRSNEKYWQDCDIQWFTLSDVGALRADRVERVTKTKEEISELGIRNSSARLLPEGTVMLSRTASVGFSAIMGRPMATSQDFVNWVCGEDFLPEYLLYIFRSMRPELRRLVMGSTHKTIYMPDIEGLRTPLPPLDEQRHIVDEIQERTHDLLLLVDKVRGAIATLQEYRSALITAAVTGKIDVRDHAA